MAAIMMMMMMMNIMTIQTYEVRLLEALYNTEGFSRSFDVDKQTVE